MKSFARLAVLACAMATSVAAQATTYDFTYTFNNVPWFTSGPVEVSGSFDGVADGNLIEDLTNMSVYVNGVAFINNSSLFSSYQTSTGLVMYYGVASFDGLENNFNITDGSHNYFQMSPRNDFTGEITYNAALLNWTVNDYVNDTGATAPTAANWTIKAVSAVPEPGTYAMLLAGLGMVALAARRRRTTRAALPA